jgi:hypothetical protein
MRNRGRLWKALDEREFILFDRCVHPPHLCHVRASGTQCLAEECSCQFLCLLRYNSRIFWAPDIAAKAYLRSARSAHKSRCANRSAWERQSEFPIRATPKLAALVEHTKSASTGMICLYRFLSPKFHKPRPVNLDSLPWRTTQRLFAHALSGWPQPADVHIARGRPASRLAPRPRHSARRVRP